jgi:DICT domain-containing protein
MVPPKTAGGGLIDIKAEIEALTKGHKDNDANGSQFWNTRVSYLQREQERLENQGVRKGKEQNN